MFNTAYLIIVDGFAEWQVGLALQALRSVQSTRVIPIGIGSLPVVSVAGMRVIPEATLSTVSLGSGAVIVIPGSDRWPLGEVASVTAFLHRGQLFRSRIAAIGTGVIPLATAGLLRSAAHTLGDDSECRTWLASRAEGYPGAELARRAAVVATDQLVTAEAGAVGPFADALLKLVGAAAEPRRAWRTSMGLDMRPAGIADQ